MRFHGGEVAHIQVGAPLVFVLADSGHAGSTARAVGAVRASLKADPERISGLIDRLGEIAEGSLDQLAAGDREGLGAQMRAERGVAAAADSFHAHLPPGAALRCDLLPDRAAAWLYRKGKTRLRLSKLAADILIDNAKISADELSR